MPVQRQQSAGSRFPSGTDLSQVLVLKKDEWDRIQLQLNGKKIEEERIQKIHQEREHQKAEKLKWSMKAGNTLSDGRHRKLDARKKREENEEEKRVIQDLQEAKFQAIQRKEAIDKAKTQLYYQTDRVKTLHGALLHTEVLKEREAQLELKKLKQQSSVNMDQQWQDMETKALDQDIQKDQERAQERIFRAQETTNFQKAQIQEHMNHASKQNMDDLAERDELEKLKIQFESEKIRLDGIKECEMKQVLKAQMKQIQDVQTMKDIEAQKEEEEDEKCRKFAAAKRKMMKLRAEKETVIQKEKQAQLEKICEKLGSQLKEKIDDEDERIRLAEEEAENKRMNEDQEKSRKVLSGIKAQTEHRHQQMKDAEKEKKEARRKELETMVLRKDADEVFRQNEEEKVKRQQDSDIQLKQFCLQQVAERQEQEKQCVDAEREWEKSNKELLGLEEEQFQEYAQRVIKHCENGGRNVYPLKKAAKAGAGGGAGPLFAGKGGIRPSYLVCDKTGVQMPHYAGSSTEQVKKHINGKSNTKARLGFAW